MSQIALSNPCRRVLLDAELQRAPEALVAGATELRPVLAGRELLLLHPGSVPETVVAQGAFDRILSGGGESDGLDLLQLLKDDGALADTLLVTPREHFVAWARKEGVAVLSPEPGIPLREVLSLGELVLRDAAILILRAKRQKEERPLLIGINGINKAGKTRFSQRLAGQLERLGFAAELVSLEIFTAPKKARQAKGYAEPERLYYKHYQMDRLQEQLLDPMRSERIPNLILDVYDPAKERVVSKRSLTLDRNSMVFLEGPFLFQEDLFTSFDFRIYLVSDFERALTLELGTLEGKERERRRDEFVRCELAAQSLYLRKETPWKRAQLVIRGMNTESPHIESWPQES